MDEAVARQLIALNKSFYQNLAAPFSATRNWLQPGVLQVLEDVTRDANILDLGCGNGGVALVLIRQGHGGQYVGLDASKELLEVARSKAGALHAAPVRLEVEFIQADLTSINWRKQISIANFDFIFAFAVLHHLPSREIRLGFLRQVGGLLAPSGRFVVSNWQFLNSPKLKARIQPWEEIGLAESQVDVGDYLLDWRSGGSGLRYVHHFHEDELRQLASESGFQVQENFLADGKQGNLALYQTWKKADK